MKWLIMTLMAAAVVLTACGKKNRDPSEYVTSDDLVVFTPTEPEEYQFATMPFAEATMPAPEKRLSYALNGTTVELSIDDRIVKTLSYYYTPDDTAIAVADYNFDGYDDIYIPYEYPTDYGYYFCYDPDKNTFREDKELSDIGRFMTVTGDLTLSQHQDDGYIDRTTDYKWTDDGELRAVQKIEIYKSYNDNQYHKDIYKYDNKGAEYLESSEVLGKQAE